MKRFKKELSWLLVTALVVSSLVVGFAQLKTEAAPIWGTGFFKLEIPIDSNSGTSSPGNSRGTNSSFRLQLINASSGIVGSTSDNVISGTNTGYGDPLENGQTTTYSSFGAGGNVAVIHSEMGAITVNNTIKQMQLVCTNYTDDWWFADVRLYYSTTGNNANWVQITSGGWQAAGGTGTWNISNDWFVNNNRTLTFNSNGGSAGNIVYDAIPGQTISSPSSAGTRTGYTYAGWSGVPARMPNANSTYYAQWTPITYTVAYNGNGNTGGSTASSSHTYDAAKNLTNNGFTKTGYNFAGWNTAAGGTGTSYSNGQSVTNLANTQGATVTLYAQWTPITYTVAYNGNGNTGGSTASSSHTYDAAKNLTANGFTRTGYTFAGWNTAANGSGTSYTNGQSVTNLTTTQGATVTLYAQWTINYYNLTYDANGGTGGSGPTSTAYGTALNPPTVTRTGHTFNGWSPPVPSTMPAANSTYTAQWTANTYNVVFNGNGNTGGTMSAQGITYGSTANLTANAFTKTGYNFAGWNTASDGSGTAYANQASYGPMGASDVTLYAQWSIGSYNLTFDANGGTGGTGPTPTQYGASISAPTVTRTGYTFNGWVPAVPPTMPGADSTYVAQWTVNQYTVSFDSNGGSAVNAITQNYGTQVAKPTDPTKTGHTFDGWYSDSGLTTAVTWPYTMGASDVTFYAKWTVNNYNITFDANGGTGGTGPTSMAYGSALSAPTVTRTGYTFSHWSPTVPATVPAQDTTYTAQWTINQYTVNFNSNGGSAVNSITQNYNTNVNEPAAPARTGYIFAGWYSDSGLTNAVTWPYTLGASDVTFYADWSLGSFNLTFDANGGTGGSGPTPTPYGTSITAPMVTRTGYTFNGWLPAVPPTMPAADSTYTAQWTINQYTVNFNSNGGSAVDSITQNYNTDVAKPADPTKEGYTFAGWYSDSGLTTAVTWPYTLGASDVTFYAKWTVNNYNITFDANGGTGGTGPTSMAYGSALSAPSVSRTGYTFNGWLPEVPDTVPAADTTYVAQWTIKQYTVSFNSNGGSAVGSITQNYGTDVAKPADPAKTGYTFGGWYSDSGLTTAVIWPYTLGASDVTFYAKWTINQYTVSFNSNGGSAVGSITQNYGTDVAKPADPAKTGYIFAGWYSDSGLTTAVTWPHTLTADVTFYAKWGVGSVNITFDANGGEGGTGPTSMTVGAPLSAPVVTRDGYVFAGWDPEVPTTVPAQSTVYTAQWTLTEVDVTMDGDDFVVSIGGWTSTNKYQIWTYQQVTSDSVLSGESDLKADQWILSMSYADSDDGILQPNGNIAFTIPVFPSSTENYVIAVRIADENYNFVSELRNAYTPDDVLQVVITKVIVDGAVTTGYELKKIEPGASINIQVVGNNVAGIEYQAEVLSGTSSTLLTATSDGVYDWDISALDPGIYEVEFTASNGGSQAAFTVDFELYAPASSVDFGLLNSMTSAYANGTVSVTPNYENGTFSFRLREPGRDPLYTSPEYSADGPFDYAYSAPGVYYVYGLVTRDGIIGTEKVYDDGIINTLVIPRGTPGGSATMTLTADKPLPDIEKGTAIEFTAETTGLVGTPEYSFWRYDATGYVLIQDWSTDNTLDWTPARIGSYTIEARAKGEGAGSYEIRKFLDVNIYYTNEEKANVTAITLNTAELNANAEAKMPIVLKANATASNSDEILYKFLVYDENMREIRLRDYSINPTCVWTPRKAGLTYTISVMVKSQHSFGRYDAIESFEITV